MRGSRTTAASLACVVAFASVALAQPASVLIPRVRSAPRLQAFLNGEPLPTEGRIAGFVQREPGDGDPGSHATAAHVSYDRDNLYVVFVCEDEASGIRARYTRRDAIEADDQVIVYLDTFRDGQRAYAFASNPVGIQADWIHTEGQGDDPSFDTIWHTDARLTPFGYVVKMTIPFRSLRFANGADQVWGIALSRQVQRLNEEVFWPLVSKRVRGLVPQFATATGLSGISPGSNIQVTPYGAFADARVGEADAAEVAREQRYGVDAKIGLGNAFVLDLAGNPDFSEVESDDPQVTVNERFEVFFPERRPFFVENAGFFGTPTALFFSRRVLDPRGGVRLTGKAGPWIAAGLAMQDRETPEAEAATVAVASVRREFGADAHVGALVTSRGAPASGNRVVSLDGRWTVDKNWTLVAQAMRSHSSERGVPGASGTGYVAEVTRDARHLDLAARYTDLSADFDAALGFVRRVDIRQVEAESTYQFRPHGGPVVRYGPTVDGFVVWNHAGQLQDWRVRPRFSVELVGQTKLRVDRSESYERYRDLDFRKHRTMVEVESEWARWLAVEAAYEWGADINRRPQAGALPSPAARRALEVSASLRPGRHVRFDQAFLVNRLSVWGSAGGPEGRVFENQLLRSKLHLQVTSEVSLRGILDCELVSPNPSLSSLRPSRPVSLDVLGTIQLNPGTALFVGYVNRYEPIDAERLRALDDFRSVGRQLFVKLSVLFRY